MGVAVPNWSHRRAAGVPLLRQMFPRALHISARRCESFRVLCLFLENRTSGILSELSEHPCVNFGCQPSHKEPWSKQPQSSSSRCKNEEAVRKGFQLDAAAPFRSTTAFAHGAQLPQAVADPAPEILDRILARRLWRRAPQMNVPSCVRPPGSTSSQERPVVTDQGPFFRPGLSLRSAPVSLPI